VEPHDLLGRKAARRGNVLQIERVGRRVADLDFDEAAGCFFRG
jgi:hypothetical protein